MDQVLLFNVKTIASLLVRRERKWHESLEKLEALDAGLGVAPDFYGLQHVHRGNAKDSARRFAAFRGHD
ncbi:hypothetical protein [Bradyrhizobium sp. USDA 4353]